MRSNHRNWSTQKSEEQIIVQCSGNSYGWWRGIIAPGRRMSPPVDAGADHRPRPLPPSKKTPTSAGLEIDAHHPPVTIAPECAASHIARTHWQAVLDGSPGSKKTEKRKSQRDPKLILCRRPTLAESMLMQGHHQESSPCPITCHRRR